MKWNRDGEIATIIDASTDGTRFWVRGVCGHCGEWQRWYEPTGREEAEARSDAFSNNHRARCIGAS